LQDLTSELLPYYVKRPPFPLPVFGLALLEIRERETGVFENFDEKTSWQIARFDGYGSSIAGPGILQ
jgi:hypothetical protein